MYYNVMRNSHLLAQAFSFLEVSQYNLNLIHYIVKLLCYKLL